MQTLYLILLATVGHSQANYVLQKIDCDKISTISYGEDPHGIADIYILIIHKEQQRKDTRKGNLQVRKKYEMRKPESRLCHELLSGLREKKNTAGGGQWQLSLGIFLTGRSSHTDQGMGNLNIMMDEGQ